MPHLGEGKGGKEEEEKDKGREGEGGRNGLREREEGGVHMHQYTDFQ